MKNIAIVFLLAVMMVSCATPSLNVQTSTTITPEKISKVKKGATTRQDLKEMFGEPETKITTSEGPAYFYKDVNLNSLWVQFNDSWVVTDYEWSE